VVENPSVGFGQALLLVLSFRPEFEDEARRCNIAKLPTLQREAEGLRSPAWQ
jgi:hypothetical protein